MIKMFAAASALALAIAAPAAAQDTTAEATFTGPTAALLLGYDNVSINNDGSDSSSDGLLYGGAIGYDFAVGSAVFGVEGEITDSTTGEEDSGLIIAGDRFGVSTDRDLYVGARAGFLVSPNVLLYAKGGYTNARVSAFYEDSTGRESDGTDLDGFRVGAGVEAARGNKFLRLEYRYSEYDTNGFDGFDLDISPARHQVAAMVGVRF